MPLEREDYTVDPMPSTLVIRPYDIEYLTKMAYKRVQPTRINFRVVETLKGRNYRFTGIVMVYALYHHSVCPRKRSMVQFQ